MRVSHPSRVICVPLTLILQWLRGCGTAHKWIEMAVRWRSGGLTIENESRRPFLGDPLQRSGESQLSTNTSFYRFSVTLPSPSIDWYLSLLICLAFCCFERGLSFARGEQSRAQQSPVSRRHHPQQAQQALSAHQSLAD